mmetsp:Transcript_68759/g.177108  ORF Transcript_68759/g.177108 Transcript_68759/m.177108 type:complete len:228 (-) Transcript_68759:371-1054(-)
MIAPERRRPMTSAPTCLTSLSCKPSAGMDRIFLGGVLRSTMATPSWITTKASASSSSSPSWMTTSPDGTLNTSAHSVNAQTTSGGTPGRMVPVNLTIKDFHTSTSFSLRWWMQSTMASSPSWSNGKSVQLRAGDDPFEGLRISEMSFSEGMIATTAPPLRNSDDFFSTGASPGSAPWMLSSRKSLRAPSAPVTVEYGNVPKKVRWSLLCSGTFSPFAGGWPMCTSSL